MSEPLTIRWDVSMGCYRVSEPNFAEHGPVRVFREEDVEARVEDRVEAELNEYGPSWEDVRPLWDNLKAYEGVIETEALDAFPAPEEWTA